jgi:hypothetical protein
MTLHVDLIDKGYFPVEIPAAFSPSGFATILPVLTKNLEQFATKSSRCAYHSIPRLQHDRRLLGIPNPLHQLKLAVTLEKHWPDLEAHMKKSPLSFIPRKTAPRLGGEATIAMAFSFDGFIKPRLWFKELLVN